MRLYHPERFQGKLSKKPYFEGWYYKQVSAGRSQVYSFIPGISLTRHQAHAFIQMINGITGESHYIQYGLEQFSWEKHKFQIKIGNSIFTRDFMDLNIENDRIRVNGRVDFTDSVRYPKSILSPGIMGWYSFVPFMECKHDVISVTHTLNGCLNINGLPVDFSGGKGYIEKDWGRSFPKAWLWVHCNTFNRHDASLMLSIADIPWLGSYFLGLICFFYVEGAFYLFNTYTKSTFNGLQNDGDCIRVRLENKTNVLTLRMIKKAAGMLTAPSNGEMNRRIKETIDSEVYVSLYDRNNRLLFEDTGIRAGLEFIDTIFDYKQPG